MRGKVYLVGAGPGDPNLLTIGALELIKKADLILYDNLIGEKIASILPKEKRVFVGKFPTEASIPQKKINDIIVKNVKNGKTVLRLKGGDPFIFGRGGEEFEYLRKRNINVKVLPGISSAIACPTSFGIPLTHRNMASSVVFLTGHKAKKNEINWRTIANFGGTIVILMGVRNLEKNVSKLIKFGMKKSTKVAIIERCSLSNQRLTVGNLGNIVEKAKNRNVKSPAIIVIGEVVRFVCLK